MAGTITSSSGIGHNRLKLYADGINNVFTITHNLGWEYLIVQVWDEITGEKVIVDLDVTTPDTIDVSFAVVPTNDKIYLVHIISLVNSFV